MFDLFEMVSLCDPKSKVVLRQLRQHTGCFVGSPRFTITWRTKKLQPPHPNFCNINIYRIHLHSPTVYHRNQCVEKTCCQVTIMIRSTWRFRVSAKRWSFFTEVTLDEIQDLFFMGILAGWWFQTI